MAGSADAIGSGGQAASASLRPTATTAQPEFDAHPHTFRVYDRGVGFTLAMFVLNVVLVAFGPIHTPLVLLVIAVVANGALGALWLLRSWLRGGTVKVDPVAHEVVWSRPPSSEPTCTWSLDEITAIDTRRKGCTNIVRIKAGRRRLLLQVPDRHEARVVDWLGHALRQP